MKVVRREFLHLAATAVAVASASRVAPGQTPATGPRLTQVLRRDLEGQGQVVQESIVSVAEFGPGSAAPWHMHPGAQEILYAMEGTVIVEVQEREAAEAIEEQSDGKEPKHRGRSENRRLPGQPVERGVAKPHR